MSAVLRSVDPADDILPAPFPIQATQDVVIIEQREEQETRSGIILPGSSRLWPQGRIVSCGPGRTYAFFMDASGNTRAGQQCPMTVKVGDYVFLGKYQSGGEPMEINGKRYLACREGDIIGLARDGEFVDVKLVAPDA